MTIDAVATVEPTSLRLLQPPTPSPIGQARYRGPVDVLHVVEAFGGGVETAIASYVANSSHLHHLVVARKRPAHDVRLPVAAQLVIVDADLPRFLRRAHAEIRRHRPRVVHLHSSFAGLLRVLPACGAEIVYTPHCFAFERRDLCSWRRRVLVGAEAVLGLRRQTIAAVSPWEGERARHVAPRAHPHYLPNVGGPRHCATRRAPGRVVTVGRVAPQKDPEFFARCVQHVTTAGLEWIWVGDGDDTAKARLASAGVRVTGWLPNEEVVEIVASAALYLHTASWEGAPVSLLEAAQQQTPVLVRAIPALAALGYTAAGRTPEGLAAAVDHYFANASFARDVEAKTAALVAALCPAAQRASLRRLYSSLDVAS